MLYFSETAWTLPDMAEINDEFGSSCDQDEFERKIAGIVRNIQRAPRPDSGEEPNWNRAVRALRNEDHYLLVLIDAAGTARPRGDFIKLVLTGLVIVGVVVAAALFFADHP